MKMKMKMQLELQLDLQLEPAGWTTTSWSSCVQLDFQTQLTCKTSSSSKTELRGSQA